MSADGLISLASNHPVRETMDRLEAMLREKGITIFARIDHAAGAAAVDMPLRPTELVIFGNPRAGTPLMQARQSIGIDLPLKMLGWQDAAGKVWLVYNDPAWLARRHGLGGEAEAAVAGLAKALAMLAAGAVA
ncbi:MAG TPA: DUF302 domain-containing protein [Verrucomicrobiae bacterium]|jgi:uncharacterized protein (DUF302 family)|nr:DUF302 domain-containing protein [Verrucomicrobiae bacterium]